MPVIPSLKPYIDQQIADVKASESGIPQYPDTAHLPIPGSGMAAIMNVDMIYMWDSTKNAWVESGMTVADAQMQFQPKGNYLDQTTADGLYGALSDVNTLKTEVGTNTTNITTLQGDVGTNTTNITNLQSGKQDHSTVLDNLSDNSGTLQYKGQPVANGPQINDSSSSTSTVYSSSHVDTLLGAKVNSSDPSLAHQTDITNLQGQINTNSSNIQTNTTNITSLQTSVASKAGINDAPGNEKNTSSTYSINRLYSTFAHEKVIPSSLAPENFTQSGGVSVGQSGFQNTTAVSGNLNNVVDNDPTTFFEYNNNTATNNYLSLSSYNTLVRYMKKIRISFDPNYLPASVSITLMNGSTQMLNNIYTPTAANPIVEVQLDNNGVNGSTSSRVPGQPTAFTSGTIQINDANKHVKIYEVELLGYDEQYLHTPSHLAQLYPALPKLTDDGSGNLLYNGKAVGGAASITQPSGSPITFQSGVEQTFTIPALTNYEVLVSILESYINSSYLSFGTSGQGSVTGNSKMQLTNSFTIEFWYKSAGSATNQYVFTHGVNEYGVITGYAGANILEFYAPNATGTSPRNSLSQIALPDSTQLHHVAWVYDGQGLIGPAGTFTCYLDGAKVNSQVITFNLVTTAGAVFYLGSAGNASYLASGAAIDDFSMQSYPKTDAQIASGYNKDKTGLSHQIAYWQFDDGSGTIAKDASGNGFNLTLTAGATFATALAPTLTGYPEQAWVGKYGTSNNGAAADWGVRFYSPTSIGILKQSPGSAKAYVNIV